MVNSNARSKRHREVQRQMPDVTESPLALALVVRGPVIVETDSGPCWKPRDPGANAMVAISVVMTSSALNAKPAADMWRR